MIDSWRLEQATRRADETADFRPEGRQLGLRAGPVIMQRVERTWVDGAGWMYTGEQLRAAVAVAKGCAAPACPKIRSQKMADAGSA